MKGLSFCLLMTIVIIHQVQSQYLTARTYLESTVVNEKIGTSIDYQFIGGYQLGLFMQRSATRLSEMNPGYYEREFYGISASYPLTQGMKKLNLDLNTRIGLVNDQNFIISPSLLASYTPYKILTFGAGIGARLFRPTFMVSVGFNMISDKNEHYLD